MSTKNLAVMVGFFPFHVGLDYNRSIVYIVLFLMSEKSLERFQKKVENIKLELDEIKKSTEASDIEKKKQDIDKKIYAATEAIDDELSELKKNSDTNKEAITKLEELKKTLDSFAPELSTLKKEVLDTNTKDTKEATKEEDKPSLFAKILYGGIIGKIAGNIPVIWDSIKERADEKLKASTEQEKKDKEDKKDDNPWFWSNAWKWIGGAALVWWAIAVWSKASSSEGGFWNTIKGRFSSDAKEEWAITSPTPIEQTPEESAPDPVVSPEAITPTPEESTPEQSENVDEKVEKEIQTMRSQWMSELYILMRMFELGYMPKVPYPKHGNTLTKWLWLVDGGPLQKLWNMKSWLMASLKYSKDSIIKQKLTVLTKNPSLASALDKQFAELVEMEKFLNTNNPDAKAFKKRFMGPDAKIKFEHIGKDPATIKNALETKANHLTNIEKNIKDLDKQITDIQKNAQAKLTEYDNLAKQHINDPQKLAEIRKQSQQYIKEYNAKVSAAQTLLLEDIAKVPSKADLARLSVDAPSLSGLLKTNGGVDAFFTKITSSKISKTAGKVWLAIIVSKIVVWGVGDISKQWFLTKETGLDVVDLGAGLVPVAGWIYDVTMAIRGKDLNGRDMRWWERWVRWWVGAASTVVDLFTFGAGGTAMRAASKIWLKTAVKATEKAAIKTTVKWLQVGMHAVSFGFLGYAISQEIVPVVIDVAKTADHKTESDIQLSI